MVLGGLQPRSPQTVFDRNRTAISPNDCASRGNNRYLASVAISALAFPGADRAYIATGLNFPDALAGPRGCGLRRAPVMLVPTSDLPSYVRRRRDRRLGARENRPPRRAFCGDDDGQAEAAALVGTTTEVIVNLTNSPPPRASRAVAELLLESPANIGLTVTVSGIATFAAAFDGHVGVVTANSFAGTDVVLLARTTVPIGGWQALIWPPSAETGYSVDPRFVTVIPETDDAGGPVRCIPGPTQCTSFSLVAAPQCSVWPPDDCRHPRNTVVRLPYLDTDHDPLRMIMSIHWVSRRCPRR